MIPIAQALDDSNLFAPWFRDRDTWTAWRAWLAAIFALPKSTEPQLILLFRAHTGRDHPPTAPCPRSQSLICGRRAGKSFVLALSGRILGLLLRFPAAILPLASAEPCFSC